MPTALPMKVLIKPLLTASLSAALVAVCCLPLYAAQPPMTAEAMPVYPGAVYDRAAEAEYNQLHEPVTLEGSGPLGDELQGLGQLSAYKKVYITNAKADEVARFYRERIGGIPPEKVDRSYIIPHAGTGTDDLYVNNWIDLSKIKSDTGSPVEYFLWHSPGGYREHVFRWIVRADEDAVRCLAVVIKDMSAAMADDPKTFKVGTYLVVLGKTYSRKAPRFTVTERDLGLPIYPGAVLDVNNSSRISLGDSIQYEYVFFSGDSQAKIVAFYEQRLGRKATASDGGKLVFILGYQEGLVVNPRGPDGRTTIVVIRNSPIPSP